ncbi:hypothetical protein OSSY52_09100 [Tepiditoga spiralis]|uniref:Uncharacterized protein n=1 Tax=Tepiditoga spiralis TaxID=2108365 RepID=A0A7G1GB05_9BACT|nr:hypothetical protein [Tepiditoga spiralis]BBE30769.1 hypothetical protein OSSY52_09100 [Tepiditoga spiralis]
MKTLSSYFILLSLTLFVIFISLFIFYFNSFKDDFEKESFDKYSKLISSTITFEIESKINFYKNKTLKEGIPVGPVKDFEFLDKTFGATTEIYNFEKENSEFILIYGIYSDISYKMRMNIEYILDEIVRELDINGKYIFIFNKKHFGDEEFLKRIKDDKLDFNKNRVEKYNNGYFFYDEIGKLKIKFLYYSKGMFSKTIKEKMWQMYIISMISFLLIVLLNNYFSISIRFKVSQILNEIYDFLNNPKKEINEHREFTEELKKIKKSILTKEERNSSFFKTYEELRYIYELTAQHNTLLIELMEFIEEFFEKDFSELKIENKFVKLEKSKKYENIDTEFYTIIKKNLIQLYEKIKKLKDNEQI